jgi:hypothetical protein
VDYDANTGGPGISVRAAVHVRHQLKHRVL